MPPDPWSNLLREAYAFELRAPIDPVVCARLGALPPVTRSFAPTRLTSFLLGRAAAQRALAGLGCAADCLDVDRHGAPRWPAETIGSITHDGSLAAAAAAPTSRLRGVGIDLQHVTFESAETIAVVATASELDTLSACAPAAHFTLVLSAKEALYKCLAPTVGAVFGFEDASVIASTTTTLRLRLRRSLTPTLPEGRTFDVSWSAQDDVVRTALEWCRSE